MRQQHLQALAKEEEKERNGYEKRQEFIQGLKAAVDEKSAKANIIMV